jgi:predicted kinase
VIAKSGLVVISGLPCTGKSRLVALLRSSLDWPVYEKDLIKESLFDSLGTGDARWSRQLSDAAYEIMFTSAARRLADGYGAIIEGNFRTGEHEERIDRLLKQMPSKLSDRSVQVFCTAQGEVLAERFAARSRHQGHLDAHSSETMGHHLKSAVQAPLVLPVSTILCDTTHDHERAIATAVTDILRFLQR